MPDTYFSLSLPSASVPTPVESSRHPISLVIPVYNVEEYLEACLDSVVAQTVFDQLEVIIVNDGSTDNGGAVARKVADAHANMTLIETENRGLGPARNLGVENASGQYVIFLDSDDMMPPEACEKLHAKIIATGADVVIGRSVWKWPDESETPIGYMSPWFTEPFLSENLRGNEDFVLGCPTAWAKIYNRDFLVSNDLTFPPLIGEDVPFALELFDKAQSIHLIPDVVYWRTERQDPDNPSIMQQAHLRAVTDRLQAMRTMLDYVDASTMSKSVTGKIVSKAAQIHAIMQDLGTDEEKQEASRLFVDFLYHWPTDKEFRQWIEPRFEEWGLYGGLTRRIAEARCAESSVQRELSDTPLVSVVIPTYGRAHHLDEVVRSCLAQTYPAVEVVVVDDNEPFSEARIATSSVMEAFADNSQVRYVTPDKTRNASYARNLGVSESRGELIALLDDDDCFEPTKLEKQVNVLRRSGPAVHAVYCGKESASSLVQPVYAAGDLTRDILYHNTSIPLCSSTLLMTKAAFDDLGGFDDDFPRHQDYELLVRYFAKYQIEYVPEVLVQLLRNTANPPRLETLLEAKNLFFSRLAHVIERFPQRVRRDLELTHLVHLCERCKRPEDRAKLGQIIKQTLSRPDKDYLRYPLLASLVGSESNLLSLLPYDSFAPSHSPAVDGTPDHVKLKEQYRELKQKHRKTKESLKKKIDKLQIGDVERNAVQKMFRSTSTWTFTRDFVRAFKPFYGAWKQAVKGRKGMEVAVASEKKDELPAEESATVDVPKMRQRALSEGTPAELAGENRKYTKLVILGYKRTGSTLLTGSLAKHPNAVSFSEVFNNELMLNYPGFDNDSEWLKEYRNQAPTDFLSEFIFQGYPDDIRCVAFKIFPEHLRKKERESLLEQLKSDKDIKFVHLKRRNLLAMHTSLKLARTTGKWSSQSGNYSDQSITLDPVECLEAIQALRADYDYMDEHFAQCDPLDITYEDLATNYNEVIQQMLDYTGLPQVELEQALKKQGNSDLSKVIANYGQVVDYLAANGFGGYIG